MAIQHSAATRLVVCDAAVDELDIGAPVLDVRTAAQNDPDDPVAGTLLVTFTLNAPAFAAATDDGTHASAALIVSPEIKDTAVATGTAQHCVMRKAAGGAVQWNGTVTGTGGGGDLELTSTSITSGTEITLVSLTYRAPQS